jgi:proteic killer suppression protein
VAGAGHDFWRIIHRKLLVLDAANNLVDLALVPGYRLEALKGDQRGRYSIRVNDQYRITFRFEGGDAHDVTCEDYH